MTILLFVFFMMVYSYLFVDGSARRQPAPIVAVVAPKIVTVAKSAPTVAAKITIPVETIEADPKPTKLVPLRKWALRHGIKGAGKMNTAQLKEAIAAAGL